MKTSTVCRFGGPFRLGLGYAFLLAYIFGCTPTQRTSVPDQPGVGSENAIQAWAREAYLHIEEVRARQAELYEVEEVMRSMGWHEDMTRDEFSAWHLAAGAEKENRPALKWAFRRRADLLPGISGALIGTWRKTGKAQFVAETPSEDLVARASGILDEYAQFLAKHEHLPQHVVVRELLEENIEAIPTEYCAIAMTVIQKWVGLGPGVMLLISAHKDTPGGVSAEDQMECYKSVRSWYDSAKDTLEWDSRLGLFLNKRPHALRVRD